MQDCAGSISRGRSFAHHPFNRLVCFSHRLFLCLSMSCAVGLGTAESKAPHTRKLFGSRIGYVCSHHLVSVSILFFHSGNCPSRMAFFCPAFHAHTNPPACRGGRHFFFLHYFIILKYFCTEYESTRSWRAMRLSTYEHVRAKINGQCSTKQTRRPSAPGGIVQLVQMMQKENGVSYLLVRV